MHIQTVLLDRINRRLTETKNPCKTYATEEKAIIAGNKLAKEGADYFGCKESANFITLYIPSINKWTVCFDQTELMHRSECLGGYLGIFVDKSFYTY